jgi:hypothetical protein
MSRELLKQALRALEDFDKHTKGVMIPSTRNQGSDAITAIRAHLDTPEQEPVAKVVDAGGICHFPKLQWRSANHSLETPIGSKLYLHPAPIPPGWLRAVDEAMVGSHLGVADASDSYEVAKKKLNDLICWNIDVATDPAVNGGMVLVPEEPHFKDVDVEWLRSVLRHADKNPDYFPEVQAGKYTLDGDSAEVIAELYAAAKGE